VIRGEEHLSNTPYHLMVADALGYDRPAAYAHMPLILAKDGAKLSKRKHPEANLMLYREQGYLPEALINYLALLGWNPGTSQEIFTLDELIDVFSFERVQHAGARFDWEKLNWVNGEWIRAMADTELAHRLEPFLPNLTLATIMRAVPALKTRMTKLSQAVDYLDYLWTHPQPPVLDGETKQRVQKAIDALSGAGWEPQPIEAALEKAVAESGVGKGKFYTPLRDALTGKKVSLPIHYTLALLPKEVALARLRQAAES
jgi:glutamyl-tRNA synthetase